MDAWIQDNKELLRHYREVERRFCHYLSQQRIPLGLIRGEVGKETLERFLGRVGVMESQLDEAADFARAGERLIALEAIGAGAKVTKDYAYSVLMDHYGGPVGFFERGLKGVPSILSGFVFSRYQAGVNRCQLILENL